MPRRLFLDQDGPGSNGELSRPVAAEESQRGAIFESEKTIDRLKEPMHRPLVSVIVPVKNGERFLAAAITSILNQDYRPLEVVIVDNGSSDGTAEIAAHYHAQISYLRQSNEGPAAARNLGLTAAHGEFIAFLDADDLWTPNKLSLQVNYLIEHPEIQYTITMMKLFLEPGCEIPSGFKLELLEGQHVGPIMPTLVAKKSLFDTIGGFDSGMVLGEDADWYARANDYNVPMAIIPEVLLHKRVHNANASSDAQTSNRELLKVLKRSIERKKLQMRDEKNRKQYHE